MLQGDNVHREFPVEERVVKDHNFFLPLHTFILKIYPEEASTNIHIFTLNLALIT